MPNKLLDIVFEASLGWFWVSLNMSTRYMMSVESVNVELKLEVEVKAENGIPSTTVRTVSENCRTLKVTDFGFDD